jgi:CHASE3 domain sensor protein
VPELRHAIAQALAALRVVADAKRAARAVDPTDIDAAQAGITAARNTIQAMRAEENRRLEVRVQANHASSRRLQQIGYQKRALPPCASGRPHNKPSARISSS